MSSKEPSSKLWSADESIGLVSPAKDENQAGRDQGAHSEDSDSAAAQSGERETSGRRPQPERGHVRVSWSNPSNQLLSSAHAATLQPSHDL